MKDDALILVVVPCYNEAGRLPVERFLHSAEKEERLHFLFVNDGSSDATASVLEEISKRNPGQISWLHLPQNAGKAEAVRQGIRKGLEQNLFDFIGFLDADLSSPPEEILYLKAFSDFRGGGHTFLFGSRMKHLGSSIYRQPMRHYFGRVAATAASVALNLPVYDTQCGVKLMKAILCENLFEKPFLSRWLFDVELFFRLKSIYSQNEFESHVLEVPLREWREAPGTKLGTGDVLKVPLELWRIRQHYQSACRF